MLMDLYRAMNKDFHPTATDIASYARIFDRTKKGKITYEDLEYLALKYFWDEQSWWLNGESIYFIIWEDMLGDCFLLLTIFMGDII